MTKTIYLDYAAATPMDSIVLKAMQPYFTEQFYNPSATYLTGQAVAKDIATARGKVANILGARPTEVIFTAGGTEANNLAIHGIMQAYPEGNVVISVIEHDSVLNPVQQYKHKLAQVQPDGVVNLNDLSNQIDDKTVLVSIMYANNEIGTIQPIHQIAQLVQGIRQQRSKAGNRLPLYLHTDACQAAAYLDLHVHRLGVDLMTLNGGKVYGPKQSGCLFIKAGTPVEPLIYGGGQEHGLRSGTENVAAIIGFSTALELVQNRREDEVKRLRTLQTLFINELASKVPAAQLNGSLKHRLPNNVHIMLPRTDNERLMMELDEQGIICAVGSACSASNDEPSHVLTAIGLSEPEAQASLRFSMGLATHKNDIIRTVTTLAQIVARA